MPLGCVASRAWGSELLPGHRWTSLLWTTRCDGIGCFALFLDPASNLPSSSSPFGAVYTALQSCSHVTLIRALTAAEMISWLYYSSSVIAGDRTSPIAVHHCMLDTHEDLLLIRSPLILWNLSCAAAAVSTCLYVVRTW